MALAQIYRNDISKYSTDVEPHVFYAKPTTIPANTESGISFYQQDEQEAAIGLNNESSFVKLNADGQNFTVLSSGVYSFNWNVSLIYDTTNTIVTFMKINDQDVNTRGYRAYSFNATELRIFSISSSVCLYLNQNDTFKFWVVSGNQAPIGVEHEDGAGTKCNINKII